MLLQEVQAMMVILLLQMLNRLLIVSQAHKRHATGCTGDDGQQFIDFSLQPGWQTCDRGLDTRQVLALGLSAALNAPIEKTTFGVFRM